MPNEICTKDIREGKFLKSAVPYTLTNFRLKCVIIITRLNFFENYAIVAMESDNVTFYACKIIKVTPGFNLKKTNFFARWCQHPQNS